MLFVALGLIGRRRLRTCWLLRESSAASHFAKTHRFWQLVFVYHGDMGRRVGSTAQVATQLEAQAGLGSDLTKLGADARRPDSAQEGAHGSCGANNDKWSLTRRGSGGGRR